MAPDGWHPRHIGLLSNNLLEVLSTLYEILERTGHMPQQQRQVHVFLLNKTSGGTRPIGLFTAFYRVWSKARATTAAAWVADHDRKYFAAGKGRSTIDPVWRQSVRNQVTVAGGQHVASVCWDLRGSSMRPYPTRSSGSALSSTTSPSRLSTQP